MLSTADIYRATLSSRCPSVRLCLRCLLSIFTVIHHCRH